MEPDVVSNQPKINRNTFKIGSGDLQQQVANNTKRIRVISTMLRSNRRRSADGLSPQATNIQQSLEQSNLILADIAIQLESDFQDRENREKRLLLRSREEKLELRRRNIEEDLEYKKTEKKITKSSNKIKGPIQGIFKTLGKILLLFGGLVLIGALLKPGAISNIIESKEFQNAKVALETTFEVLTKNMKAILIVAGAIVGLKLAASLVAIVKVGAGILAILANPLLLAGIGVLLAAGLQGLGGNEKEVIEQLQEMGGFSKENRDARAQRYRDELAAMPFLERQIKKGEYESRIKFLETGDYSSGGRKAQFDWSKLDGMEELSGFENFMLNFDTDTTNMKDDKDLVKDKNNKVTKIEIEGETIDLRQNNKKQFNESPSETSATNVALVNPVDNNNRYMSEFPEAAGFNDSIFT